MISANKNDQSSFLFLVANRINLDFCTRVQKAASNSNSDFLKLVKKIELA